MRVTTVVHTASYFSCALPFIIGYAVAAHDGEVLGEAALYDIMQCFPATLTGTVVTVDPGRGTA